MTGKTELVPADMTCKEWYGKYVVEPRERELSGRQFGANLDYVRSDEFVDKLKNHPKTSHISEPIEIVLKSISEKGTMVLQRKSWLSWIGVKNMALTLEKFNEVYKQLEAIDSSEFGNSEDDSIQEKMSTVFAQLSLDELDEFEEMLKERST